jgi:murein DD-endopeptidase MepM/ murein hydrolase activator NlpD
MGKRRSVFSHLACSAAICIISAACIPVPVDPVASADPGKTPATAVAAPSSTVTVSPSPTATVAIPPTDTPTTAPTQIPTQTKNAFRYVFPVQPQEKTDFAAGGHPYPATDIFTEVGSQFVAVTDGLVDFVSYTDLWDPATDDPAVAGGLCVAIVGDDGIRYYGSHLSAVAAGIRRGARVEAGQLLGLTGKSGNAANTTPHLHFGISHPTYPEDWKTRRGELDPYPYLVAWSRGENVTPRFPTPVPTAGG